MRARHLLVKRIEEATALANELRKSDEDEFAECMGLLWLASELLKKTEDKSAECKCGCHTHKLMHCAPCGCYSGNPITEEE